MNRAETRRKQALARVRSNAWSAGFAAALMLFFGYGFGLYFPDQGWLYNLACKAFIYTLQGGGILLAVVAVLCLIGLPQALYLDAFVSGLIGLVFVLSSLVQVLHGGYVALLYGIFGVMFIHSAVRNYRAAYHICALETEGAPPKWQEEPPPPPKRSAASDLLERLRGPESPEPTPMHFEPAGDEAPRAQQSPPCGPAEPQPASAAEPAPASPVPPGTPPPSGALAAQAAEPAPQSPEAPAQAPAAPETARSEPAAERGPEPDAPPPGGFLAALAKEEDEQD